MSMNGIDISSWQAGIDLEKVPCEFVIVKATGGVGYVNPDCDRACSQAKKNEKKLGLYHYAREEGWKGSAADEADFFLKHCEEYIGEALLALDWEADLGVGEAWVKKWLDRVYEKTGVKPLFYTSKGALRNYDWSAVAKADYGLWVAQYASNAPVQGYQTDPWTDSYGYGAWKAPAIFQYAKGCLNGYPGLLDLNVAYMDRNGWDQYAKSRRIPPEAAGPDAPQKRAELTGPVNVQFPVVFSGCTGTGVKMLQAMLGVETDGIFGTNTENALKAFQKNVRLSADGICGENTWRAVAAHMDQNTFRT